MSTWHADKGLVGLVQDTARQYGLDNGLQRITITIVTDHGSLDVQSIGGSTEHGTVKLVDLDDHVHLLQDHHILRISFSPPKAPAPGRQPAGFLVEPAAG
jgi:hypothetical protein